LGLALEKISLYSILGTSIFYLELGIYFKKWTARNTYESEFSDSVSLSSLLWDFHFLYRSIRSIK
jgi:hypothetical protein